MGVGWAEGWIILALAPCSIAGLLSHTGDYLAGCSPKDVWLGAFLTGWYRKLGAVADITLVGRRGAGAQPP